MGIMSQSCERVASSTVVKDIILSLNKKLSH